MASGISSRTLTRKLDAAYRHWDMRRRAHLQPQPAHASTPALSVTISREAGTQGTAVAEEVGSRLQWQVYDHQLLELVAQDMGVRAKLLESIDEKRTTWLLEDFESALGVPMVTEPAYVHHLVRTVLALSSHGECVIVGRGAAQILSGPHTFRVRLVAPLQWRLQAVCREHGMKMDEAKAYLQDTDREHAAFVRELFQKDPAEAHQYDLIINRAHFGVAECAGLIVEGVRALQPRRS